ncbi:MAG: DNA polymerase III subunit alpha, partial [Methylocystaceae bacterium]
MFVHLHCHSPFSFLDGASSIDELVSQTASLGMPALAITDHDNLCAAVKFQQAAEKMGIKPIQGAEITLESGYHLVLLATGPKGYRSLCRIITRAQLSNSRKEPRVSWDTLVANQEDLIALSGCRRGEIPALIWQRKYGLAQEAAQRYVDVFGPDNFFLELQGGLLPGDTAINDNLANLAETSDIGLVATSNVHYSTPDILPVHDILTCIRTLSTVTEINAYRPMNSHNYLKSPGEMQRQFATSPSSIENTFKVAERCQPALNLSTSHFPAFTLQPGETAPGKLRELTFKGAYWRYKQLTPGLQNRIEHELQVINTLGFADYFLAVWDITRYARSQRIRFAGRGSAADSAVAFCLGITEVDAWNRGLLFERFMSLERRENPDIDVDFDSRYRDKVAEYVYQKYGKDHVASVATYNTFQARSALRDIGKALGLSEEEVGALAKKMPWVHADGIRRVMEHLPELRNSNIKSRKFELLLDLCEKVAGFPRFLGTHLGGLVISREPLIDITPLQTAAKGMVITQFDKDDVEALGLIKLDLLSLRTLGAVDDAVVLINREQEKINYDEIPMGDPDTYELLRTGHTIGVFQLESPAQRALQARLGASTIEDLVASVALIRPGPIKGNMVEPFIDRRQGKEPIVFLHPRLEPILKDTYGVILYQEQVLEIAEAIAGFTPGEADQLRRVMSHARSQAAMEEIGRQFVARAEQNGIERELAVTIFSQMVGYASYGFCEGHAAAFGTTAYKTAYLLEHYPAEFYAAILSNQPMGYYPPHIICLEARNKDISILPPDINCSEPYFTVEEGNIRVSLSQIKGLSRNGIEDIINHRPFTSLGDLVLRTGLSIDELQSLIKCGTLDTIEKNRRGLISLLPAYVQRRKQAASEQASLIDEDIKDTVVIADFSDEQKRTWEIELLGIDVRGHVMEKLRSDLKNRGYLSSRDIAQAEPDSRIKVAGLLYRPHRPPTRSGRITVFMSLEDEWGLTDVTVFEDVYQKYGQYIFAPQTGPLAVEGILQKRGNAASVVAHRLKPY